MFHPPKFSSLSTPPHPHPDGVLFFIFTLESSPSLSHNLELKSPKLVSTFYLHCSSSLWLTTLWNHKLWPQQMKRMCKHGRVASDTALFRVKCSSSSSLRNTAKKKELKKSLYTTQSKNKHNMISSKYLCIIIVIHGFVNVTLFFKQKPYWATQPGKSSSYFRIKIQSDTEYRLSNKSDFFFSLSLFLRLMLDCPDLWCCTLMDDLGLPDISLLLRFR